MLLLQMPGGKPMTYPFPYKTGDGLGSLSSDAFPDPLEIENLIVHENALVEGDLTVVGSSTSRNIVLTDFANQIQTTASQLDIVSDTTHPEFNFLNESSVSYASTVRGGDFNGTHFVGLQAFNGSSFTTQTNTNTSPNNEAGFAAMNELGDALEMAMKGGNNSRRANIRTSDTAFGLDINVLGSNKTLLLQTDSVNRIEIDDSGVYIPVLNAAIPGDANFANLNAATIGNTSPGTIKATTIESLATIPATVVDTVPAAAVKVTGGVYVGENIIVQGPLQSYNNTPGTVDIDIASGAIASKGGLALEKNLIAIGPIETLDLTPATRVGEVTAAALKVSGGLVLGKNALIQDVIVEDDTPATIVDDMTAASIKTFGGIAADKNLIVKTSTQFLDPTDLGLTLDGLTLVATSSNTFEGGLKVVKRLTAASLEGTPIGVTFPSSAQFLSVNTGPTVIEPLLQNIALTVNGPALFSDPTNSTESFPSIKTLGGVKVAKTVESNKLDVLSTDEVTGPGTGSALFAGGIQVAKTMRTKLLEVTDPIDATATTSGSITTAGGLGVAKTIYADKQVITNLLDATSNTTGALIVSGGVGIAKTVFADQAVFTSTLDSTSTTTGSVRIAGGLGVEKSLYCGHLTAMDLNAEDINCTSVTATGAIKGATLEGTTSITSPLGNIDEINSDLIKSDTFRVPGLISNEWTQLGLSATAVTAGTVTAGEVTGTISVSTQLLSAAVANIGVVNGGIVNSALGMTVAAGGVAIALGGLAVTAGGIAVVVGDILVAEGNIRITTSGQVSAPQGFFNVLSNDTAAGSSFNAATIGAITPGTGKFTSLQAVHVGDITPGTAVFTTLNNSTAAGSALNAASIGATTQGTGFFTTAQATQFQTGVAGTGNFVFKTALDTTDYSLLGTNATDGDNNTRIIVSGFQRSTNAGGIEYRASQSGQHVFYNQGSMGDVYAGRFTTNNTHFFQYLEGTWTVVIGGTGTFTTTFSTNAASYSRVGKQVTVSINLAFASTGTINAATISLPIAIGGNGIITRVYFTSSAVFGGGTNYIDAIGNAGASVITMQTNPNNNFNIGAANNVIKASFSYLV